MSRKYICDKCGAEYPMIKTSILTVVLNRRENGGEISVPPTVLTQVVEDLCPACSRRTERKLLDHTRLINTIPDND